jgi:DNA-binding transcriptional LysR family regulator
MTLHQLTIFLAVCKFHSFTQAADDLKMSQPDVSVQIRNLENEIGLSLFERLGKKFRLTEAGEVLRERATNICSQVEDTRQVLAELKGMVRGSLVVGASTTIGMYLLSNPISEFSRRFPGIKTHLKTGTTGAIEEMVLNAVVDLGFTVGVPIPEVKSEIFMDDELVLIHLPRHAFSAKKQVRLEDLSNENFILRGPGSLSHRVFVDLFRSKETRPNIGMELDNTQAVKWAVAEGLGISLIPKHAVMQEIKRRLLSIKRIDGIQLHCPLNIISHPQRKFSPATRAFLDLIRSYFEKRQQLSADKAQTPCPRTDVSR